MLSSRQSFLLGVLRERERGGGDCVSVRGNRVFLPFDYVRRVVRRVKKVGRDGAKHARGSGGLSRHGGKGEEEIGRDGDRERRDTHSERDREIPQGLVIFVLGA